MCASGRIGHVRPYHSRVAPVVWVVVVRRWHRRCNRIHRCGRWRYCATPYKLRPHSTPCRVTDDTCPREWWIAFWIDQIPARWGHASFYAICCIAAVDVAAADCRWTDDTAVTTRNGTGSRNRRRWSSCVEIDDSRSRSIGGSAAEQTRRECFQSTLHQNS